MHFRAWNAFSVFDGLVDHVMPFQTPNKCSNMEHLSIAEWVFDWGTLFHHGTSFQSGNAFSNAELLFDRQTGFGNKQLLRHRTPFHWVARLIFGPRALFGRWLPF